MFTKYARLLLFLLIIVLVFVSCDTQKQSLDESKKDLKEKLKVHFIDIGQGDSILIEQDTYTMLIDTGPKESEKILMDYLASQNIKKIDYLVLTHQHRDHIGNAAMIIKNFKIETLYLPNVTSNTTEFKNMTKALKTKRLSITRPISGSSFNLGEAQCHILAPNSETYENENDYSIVIKMVYKNTSFLFTGDAQPRSEKEMIDKGYDLSADILKIAQHGNDKTTSKEFLNIVNPKYAALSCALNDSNDHPSKKVMKLFKEKDIPVYRTDQCGTIVCTSDGENLTFDKEPGDYKHGKN